MLKKRAKLLALTFVPAMLLVGCGESTDEAYQRGYDEGLYDGWAYTCNNIERFNSRIADVLERERIC